MEMEIRIGDGHLMMLRNVTESEFQRFLAWHQTADGHELFIYEFDTSDAKIYQYIERQHVKGFSLIKSK